MIDDKKVLAITLARAGSISVKNKNTAIVNGFPLIEWTFTEVAKSKYIDDYFVSTNDPVIKDLCLTRNIKVINRPEELATATAKSADALIHAVQDKSDYHYIVEVMATNPLKQVNDIDGCIEKISKHNYESVVSVVRVWDRHPSRVKYIENDTMKDFYPETPESRRQDLTPAAYVRNGSIYAMTYGFLMREKSRYNKQSHPYIMSEGNSINIDSEIDLEVASIMLKKRASS